MLVLSAQLYCRRYPGFGPSLSPSGARALAHLFACPSPGAPGGASSRKRYKTHGRAAAVAPPTSRTQLGTAGTATSSSDEDLPPSLASAVLPCEASHKRLNIAGIEVTAGLLALEHCTCALCLGLPVVGRLEETGADESDSVNARGLGDDPLHRSENLWTIS